MPLSFTNARLTQGTASVSNSGATATLLAAPAAASRIRVVSVNIAITVAATGGSGVISLKDGAAGTVIWRQDANTIPTTPFNVWFGEDGYALAAGNLLQLVAESAATNQASATAAATGFIIQ